MDMLLNIPGVMKHHTAHTALLVDANGG